MFSDVVLFAIRVSYYTTFALSVTFNGVLLYFIFKTTSSKLKLYSLILLQGVIIDIVTSCLFVYMQYYLESADGYVFTASSAPWNSKIQGTVKCVWTIFHVTFPILCNWSGPIRGFYRYLIFCRRITLSPWHVFCIYSFVTVWMTAAGCIYVAAFSDINQNPGAMTTLSNLAFWENRKNDLNRFCVAHLLNYNSAIFLSSMFFFVNVAAFSLPIFNRQAKQCLSSSREHMQPRTIQVQGQIGRQLALQAVLPFLCAFLGICVIFTIVVMPNYSIGVCAICTWKVEKLHTFLEV
uniref:G_PROTEIN_RECEP_F1_2 domain-containing protein n=1 Tax=Panagrellus redivivus TaxID=6233 RepID=A0A7E4VK99_PANRE